MNMTNDRYWNETLVMAYLQEAAAIHRRLPPTKIPSYRTLWPETMKDDWERLYDLLHSKTSLGSPMPPEVTYHEEVMGWLRYISRHHQQVVWMRANKVPWKIVMAEKGRSKQTLWRDMRYGLCQIATMLHVKDLGGVHHRGLRLRANGTH